MIGQIITSITALIFALAWFKTHIDLIEANLEIKKLKRLLAR